MYIQLSLACFGGDIVDYSKWTLPEQNKTVQVYTKIQVTCVVSSSINWSTIFLGEGN